MKRLGFILILIYSFIGSYGQEFSEKDGLILLNNEPYTGKYEVKEDGKIISEFSLKEGLKVER